EKESDKFIKSSVEDLVSISITPFADANEDECFDPGGDVDEIDAFDILSNFEDGYYDSKRDIEDYRIERIDIHYRREYEIKIDELKRRFNSFCYDDDDYEESTFPLNEIVSLIPPSIAITFVLPIEDPEDSLIIGDEDLSTILEKESDKFIKSSVEDLVSISSESENAFDSACDLPLCVTPFADANEDECFDPGGDVDEIDAFDILSNFEDGYYDSKRDVHYLESFLSDDTTPNLPPRCS
nr:hypothetical protein [Tanacetum cinerariifolium]